MSLRIRTVVSEGISLVTSRNGVLLAGSFLAADALGLLLFLVGGTTYIPVDLGTGIEARSGIPAGELPETTAAIATTLMGVFTTIVTLPLSVVAIRTFVGGVTDEIPDEYLFRRIGRASLSGGIALVTYSALLMGIVMGAAALALGLLHLLSGTALLGAWLVLFLLAIVGLGLVWLHFQFLLHEIGVRDERVVGAFRGSWTTVRKSRVKLAVLAGGLAVLRTGVGWGWGSALPSDGSLTLHRMILLPAFLVVSAIVGVFAVASLARAYRTLHPEIADTEM